MNILVIGGAGYIGSHVVRALIDHGHRVTVYDNMSSGKRENVFDDTPFVKNDVMDYGALLDVMKKDFDGLVHLAAFKAAGESMIRPEKYSINNISGTLNILNAASTVGINRFVFSSSAAVYGEPQYLPIDEKHPTIPKNYYGFTKLEIERFLEWYDRLKGIRYAALRYFNAAGYDVKGRVRGLETNPENLLPIILEVASGMREKLQIFGDDYGTRDGTCIRDYVHVGDLANAHVAALEFIGRTDSSLTVNLGSDNGVSVKEMVEAARRITGHPIPVEAVDRRAGDPAELYATSLFAKESLSWQPRHINVEDMISTAWDIYRTKMF